MLDASEKYKITERYVVSVLRRVVKGDYEHLYDIRNEGLAKAGFDFTTATVLAPTNLFQDLVRGGRTSKKTKDSLLDNEGAWHFALQSRDSRTASELQAAVWTRDPHQMVDHMLSSGGLKEPLIIKAHQDGHFLILNGEGIKHLARSADD